MKILVIRLSSIGDIVLTTPVVRCLKTQSDCTIHFLTKKKFGLLVENNPYIDKVILFDGDLSHTIKELKAENYDYIVDLHHNTRSRIIKSRLHKKSSTFNKLNFKKLLLTKLKINTLPNIHIVDRYLETVKPLGIVNDYKGLDFFIDEKDTLPCAITIPEKYNVFAIGGQHKTKIVPSDIISDIISKISDETHTPFILIGGKENISDGEFISSHSNAINLAGMLTINQSAIIMQNAENVYTGDTGMMHIAAALKKNVISFWGNTVPEFGMYPYFPKGFEGKNIIVENKKLPCRPCHKLGYNKCPKGHFKCMRWIDANFQISDII